MEMVVDTNVVVSACLKRSVVQELLFDRAFRFFAPEFVGAEIEKHKAEFMEKAGYSEKEFRAVLESVLSSISIVPGSKYEKCRKEVLGFSPDKDDWPFLALALHLEAPLWSFDKKLAEGQKRVKVISVEELLKISNRN